MCAPARVLFRRGLGESLQPLQTASGLAAAQTKNALEPDDGRMDARAFLFRVERYPSLPAFLHSFLALLDAPLDALAYVLLLELADSSERDFDTGEVALAADQQPGNGAITGVEPA